ncbi:MAG: DUF1844 domain-containing protein [Myxococcota bacterium]
MADDEPKGSSDEPQLPEEQEAYPPLDFNTFVLSLSTSALMNMGEVPDPNTGETEHNLALARQTIDLIALLEDKTKGNLSGEEERLISQVLYDLRMRYLAAFEKQQKK